MAESDPRKIRPFGKTSERRDVDAEEDPLVELARIVSEDRGTQRPVTERAPPPPEPTQRNAYSGDLEAELLQELESSFAPRAPAKPAMPRAPAPAAQPPQADDADHLLRSIEAQLGEFERRAQTPPPARPRALSAEDRQADPRPVRPRLPISNQPETPSARQDRWESDAALTPSPRVEPRQRVASIEPQRAARPTADQEYDEPAYDEAAARLPLRRRDRSAAAETEDYPPRGSVSGLPPAGWKNVLSADERGSRGGQQDAGRATPADYHGELRTTFAGLDESRAPQHNPAAEPEGAGAELVSELEPTYSDPSFGAHWDRGGSDLDGDPSDEPRVAPARPLDPGMRTSARRQGRSSRKGMLAAAGVLGVLVLGGAVLALMRTSEEAPSGPPPVIAAPQGDAKVQAPEPQQAEGETVGEAVYNRVAGAQPSAEEQVVEGAEEPREISRIVLPPPQAESDEALVKPVANAEIAAATPAGAASGGAVAIGPRRVRTYVVRPDGTISASGARPAPQPVAQPPVPAASSPIEPVRVATTSVRVGDAPAPARTAASDPAAAAPANAAPAGVAPVAETAAEPPAAPEPQMAAVNDNAATDSAAPALPSTEPAAAAPVASVAPAAEAPAAAAPAASAPAGGGYVIQVSSQRSMAEAQSSLAALKERYGSIVGDLPTDVQQADLGEKGVYFRARVGRWATRAEAIEVCEALQVAGGSCFVTQ